MAEWRAVPDYEGLYEVSDMGGVRSLYFDPARSVAVIQDSNNYPTVMLTKERKRTPKTLHRLVCRAFHGEPQDGQEAAHNNGDREDCRAANLRWATRSENMRDKEEHGTAFVGEAHPRARLTASQVLAIRASDRTAGEWAAELGVSVAAVTDARSGRRWRHL